ncbi:MAG: YARHG domain-containing protein [Hyphomicrobiales bacterium]|nr:YARHG domain-containing protein [Hyphomicrobiales bacterium]
MRPMFAALLGMAVLAMLAADGARAPALSQSCQELWVERNAYYKRNGYCFRTARAIAYFGNGGCTITNMAAVPLSRAERARVAQIVAQERAMGCPN